MEPTAPVGQDHGRMARVPLEDKGSHGEESTDYDVSRGSNKQAKLRT
jgi:hypothetical protein